MQPQLWAVSRYAAALAVGLAAAVVAVAWRAPAARAAGMARWLLIAASGALIGWAAAGLQGTAAIGDRLDPALEGQDLTLDGVIAGLPNVSEQGVGFAFEPRGAAAGVPGRVQLTWYSPPDAAALRPGTQWRLTVRLRAPHGTVNFHGFDYELYLLERGIGGVGYVRPRGERQLLGRDVPWPYAVDALRDRIKRRIDALLGDAPYKGVVQALAVGDQSAIDRDDWRVFRDTGIGHLMSISGLHVTMFAWLAGLLAGASWRLSPRLMLRCPAPTAAGWIGLAAATLYTAIAGWGVPAQRTLFMLAVAIVARQTGKRYAWFDVLLAALIGVVLLDPWALLQAGFWLSFAAVGYLFWGGTQAAAQPGEGWRTRLHAAVHTQAVATLALAPLTVLFFQQLSLVSPLANALAIPLVSLVVTPLAVVAMLLPSPLADALWWTAHGLLALLQQVLEWLAGLPHAVASLPAPETAALLFALAGIALLVAPAVGRLRWLGLPMLLPLLLIAPPRSAPGEFEAQFMDVGQGTAVLVRTARHDLLYDTGPRYASGNDAGERIVAPMLRALGVRRLDALLISHRDSDHAGGAASILGVWPATRTITSVDGDELPGASNIERCAAGQRWEWDGVRFELLHPLPGDYGRSLKPNAMSCVLKVTAAHGASVLLTGDAEAPQELAMIARDAAALRATVLLVGHHGSRTSSSDAFLDSVRPQAAVIQVGYRSRYGHPHPAVLARYAARGIAVHRADCEGGLAWSSAKPQAWRQARAQRWHYWRHTGGAGCAGTVLATAVQAPDADFEEDR